MATQAIRIALIAEQASSVLVKALIEGCQLNDIGGVCVIQEEDYAAQAILENLHLSGLDVQLPGYTETGTGLLNILMYVPDEQRERVDKWYEENFDRIDRWDWGVQIGDTVISPEPEKTDSFQYQFAGTVVGFRCAFAQVEDMSGDVLDRKSTRLNSSHIQKSRMPSSA